jgi:hypothetical protein
VEHLRKAEAGSESLIDESQAVVHEVVPITASGQLIGQLKKKRMLEASVVRPMFMQWQRLKDLSQLQCTPILEPCQLLSRLSDISNKSDAVVPKPTRMCRKAAASVLVFVPPRVYTLVVPSAKFLNSRLLLDPSHWRISICLAHVLQ